MTARSIDVLFEDPALLADIHSIRQIVWAFDTSVPYQLPPGSVAIRFVSKDTCRELHSTFFGDPELTDVMTFPGDPEDFHAGDIAICPAFAWNVCREYHSSFPRELLLYLVHCLLHLAGFRDKSDNEIMEMRAAEQIAMELLIDRCGIPEWSYNPDSQ